MKTLILSAASLLLVVFSASAQKKVNKEERKEKKEAIKASLDLSKEQQVQWENIDEKFKTEQQKLKADETLSDEEKRKASEKLRAEKREAIGALLTKEQKETLRESKEKERAEKKAEKEAKLFEELKMTAKQQMQFRSVNEKYDAMGEEIKDDKSLTDEAKEKELKNLRKDRKKLLIPSKNFFVSLHFRISN